MKCPFCDSMNSKVVDKRNDTLANRRRRECLKCESRFTTYERIELKPLMVKKKNKIVEHFNKDKLMKGIMLACEKRHISSEKIDNIVLNIEKSLRDTKKRTVTTRFIGSLVMHELKELDAVAYLRFASVYQNFKNIKAFESEVKKLK